MALKYIGALYEESKECIQDVEKILKVNVEARLQTCVAACSSLTEQSQSNSPHDARTMPTTRPLGHIMTNYDPKMVYTIYKYTKSAEDSHPADGQHIRTVASGESWTIFRGFAVPFS